MKTAFKYTRHFLFLIAAGSLLAISSCKKEEKEPEPEPAPAPAPAPALTNTQKLTGKNWKLTASTVDPGVNTGSVTITNWYGQMAACDKDDLFTFNTNGTVNWDEGGSKCNTNDPQTTAGTWVWNTNETVITTTFNGSSSSMTVLTNDGNTLKVQYVEEFQGTNYTFTDTYSKQ